MAERTVEVLEMENKRLFRALEKIATCDTRETTSDALRTQALAAFFGIEKVLKGQ